MFERKEKIELKYKIGDKLMGYAEGIDGGAFVAGIVIVAEPSTTCGFDNEYKLLLDCRIVEKKEVEDGKKIKIDTWWIGEKEATPFDEDRFIRALAHVQKRRECIKMAREEYIAMHKELYPERYIKQDTSDDKD